MKTNLETILSIAKVTLASSLSALSLYAQQPFQIKTTDGNWNEKAPTTLYFESTLGNIGTDPKKDQTKQYKSSVYFAGRKKSENLLEFMYLTTDPENPKIDTPTLNNTQTKVLSFCEEGNTIEIEYQKAIMMNNKGEVRFEETVPKEIASSTLMKFGINLTDKASQKIEDHIMLKTGGLLEIDVKEGLKKYCEKQTKDIINAASENTGYQLAINNIPLWTRDRNFAIRDKQIGWIMGLSVSSEKKKEVPLALYFHLALERENEKERGSLNAYTEAFTMPAKLKQTQTCQNIQNTTQPAFPFAGFWRTTRNDQFYAISEGGNIIPLDPKYFTTKEKVKRITQTSPTEGIINYCLFGNGNGMLMRGEIGRVKFLENKTVEIKEEANTSILIKMGEMDTRTRTEPQAPTKIEKSFTRGVRVNTPRVDQSKEEKTSPGLVDKIPSGNKETLRNVGKLFGK